MAKNDIPSYDAVAANNTEVQSVDISENCSPAGINNAIREVMADLKNVDTGAVALTSPSASQLNVDNLRLDGNTISSTDTNGNITLDPNGTGVTAITGGFTATDGCTITTADNDPQLTLVSTDADANEGPILKFYRNSASPADNDLIGQLLFHGEDGAGNDQQYANIQSIIMNNAQGNEDGRLTFRTLKAGTATSRLDITNAETVFNDSSVDVDFRVESNGAANMLFVDGGNDAIGINTNSPLSSSRLHIFEASRNGGYGINGSRDSLIIEDSQHAGMSICGGSGNGGTASIAFPNGSSNIDGLISYNLDGRSLEFHAGGSERMRLDSSGNLLVGQSSQSFSGNGRVSVLGAVGAYATSIGAPSTSGAYYYIDFRTSGGTQTGAILSPNGTSTSYNTSSDYRLKENVTGITNATDRLKQLNPVRFNFIADADTTVDGFLAHEVSDIVPEAISGEKDAMKDEEYEVSAATGDIYTPATDDTDEVIHSSNVEQPEELADGQQWRETTPAEMGTRSVPDYQQIDQSKIVPLLVATIQELEARIAALEA